MKYLTPPLHGLRALDVVARLKHIGRAAEALSVTPPTITQHIQTLESYLGVTLVKKKGKNIELSPLAELYSSRLNVAFDEIRSATFALARSKHQEELLTISMYISIASRLFIPLLSQLREAHPDLQVKLITNANDELSAIDLESADCAIYYGASPPENMASMLLFPETIFPVCSPQYYQRYESIENMYSADKTTFLRVTIPTCNDWPQWFKFVNKKDLKNYSSLFFGSLNECYVAASNHLGVAMAHEKLVAQDLQEGRLIKPFGDTCLKARGAYYLVCHPELRFTKKIKHFRSWIKTLRL